MSPRLLHPRLLGIWLVAASVSAAAGSGEQRVYVTCPVYRDTNAGRKSGCWLATDEASGIRYDVSASRTKPQLGHEILVEGRLSDAAASTALPATPCGGIMLQPVVVSVLSSLCPSHMVPAEGYPGRRFKLDPHLVLAPADVPEELPAPPFGPRAWHIEFSYGSDFLQYQYSEVILDEIGRYVRASHPLRIQVIGYAVSETRTVSGHQLAEPGELARARAESVALALERLGADRHILHIQTRENPGPLAGEGELTEPSRRRVDVSLTY